MASSARRAILTAAPPPAARRAETAAAASSPSDSIPARAAASPDAMRRDSAPTSSPHAASRGTAPTTSQSGECTRRSHAGSAGGRGLKTQVPPSRDRPVSIPDGVPWKVLSAECANRHSSSVRVVSPTPACANAARATAPHSAAELPKPAPCTTLDSIRTEQRPLTASPGMRFSMDARMARSGSRLAAGIAARSHSRAGPPSRRAVVSSGIEAPTAM